MESEHFMGKVSLRALIERDGKFLLCKGVGDTLWQLPGGRMHVNETPQVALARELQEELGLSIVVGNPFYIEPVIHGKTGIPQIVVAFRCSAVGDPSTMDTAELEEVRWVSKEEFKTLPMFSDCRGAADEYLKN